MEPPDTVFYLIPSNEIAEKIVDHPQNSNRTWPDPDHPSVPWLRIGLDQAHKTPTQIARFGGHAHNDVVLPPTFFSRSDDQCHFSFNKETGELVLRDLSVDHSTHLYPIEVVKGKKKESIECQLLKQPRQCVVLLSPDPYRLPNDPRGSRREYVFKIREAEFWLVPPATKTTRLVEEARIAFANQPDPEQTAEGSLERFIAFVLQLESLKGTTASYHSSLPGSRKSHNTRFRTLLDPDDASKIHTTKLRRLGRGGQGEVHLVVDNYNRNHIACKILPVSTTLSLREFRIKMESEVKLVQSLRHISFSLSAPLA